MPPLQGFTVGITAARRWEDQAQHLASRGAEILHAAALRTDPADPEGALRHVTSGLGREIEHLRTDVHTLADRVRRQKERIRTLEHRPRAG